MSSTLNHLFGLQEQICYVQCGFCTTFLLVSVPYSSMEMVLAVRCGHCNSLFSVNMAKASFVPLHNMANSLNHHNQLEPEEDNSLKIDDAKEYQDKRSPSLAISSDDEDDDSMLVNQTVNKPPGKRQRAPSAYNNFIKEEIKRLKVIFPGMTHKEAFSTAAKNWALVGKKMAKTDQEEHLQVNGFSERVQAPMHSIFTKANF